MPFRLINPVAPLMKNLVSQCAVCHSWPAQRICTHCMLRFGQPLPRCCSCALRLPPGLSAEAGMASPRCADCIRRRPPLDACFAAVPYAYPWSAVISEYKFGSDVAWAGIFADRMLQVPGVLAALEALQGDDWLLPMPLAPARLQFRGFNQAWELTRSLAVRSRTLGRSDGRLLMRIRETRPQALLKREARLQNVSGAFSPDPLRAAAVKGRRVVLVDDVMTSGASLFAAAQSLRDAGAAHVTALVFARTE